MPTTETVRTDYRRKKKMKNLYEERQTNLSKKLPQNYVIICLSAPQLSLQIQVQISQKP